MTGASWGTGIGFVLGLGVLYFLGLRHIKRKASKLALTLLVLLMAGGVIYLSNRVQSERVVFVQSEREALAPDWNGVKVVRAELSQAWLTLRPGTGALWAEKSAPTTRELSTMQVKARREGDTLAISTVVSPNASEYANFSLVLEAPLELARVEVLGTEGYVGLRVYGLPLTALKISDASLEVWGGMVEHVEVGKGGWVKFVRTQATEIKVVESRFPRVELSDPVIPPPGTSLSMPGTGTVLLWSLAPLHVIVEADPDALVVFPKGAKPHVEDLAGEKRWETGPEGSPPLTVKLGKGEFRWLSP